MDMVKGGCEYGWACLKEIKDRIEKIEESNDKVVHILKQVEFIDSQLKKIEGHLDDKQDSQQLEQFYLHLKTAKETCQNLRPKSYAVKFFKASGIVTLLKNIEKELQEATQQLNTFIEAMHLVSTKKSFAGLNNEIAKLKIMTECPDSGIYVTVCKFQKPPVSPKLLVKVTISRFLLSWEPVDETVANYELCYDDDEPYKKLDGGISSAEPWVVPGKVYTMKIRGINSGGKGDWSNSVVAQFNKPVPRQPPLPQIKFESSTMAIITVNPPEKACSTESSITHWLIEYVEDGSGSEWLKAYYHVLPERRHLVLRELKPNQRYHFQISAKNAEGWSKPSAKISNTTKNVIPKKPTKFRISSYRTHSLIKIRWNPPEHNKTHITHYEVRKRTKREATYSL